MKHTKRILSVLLAVMMALALLMPTAQAAPADNLNIYTPGGVQDLIDVRHSGEWKGIPVPLWFTDSGEAAYCLESNMAQPYNEGYHMSTALYNTSTLNGLKAILFHGAPSRTGSLSLSKAMYATQVAIWCWMYESAGIGFSFYTQSNLRSTSGNQDVWDFYVNLMNKARASDLNVPGGATLQPGTVTLTNNGTNLVGTTTITINSYIGGYTIDQSKLPSGVTVTGSTYQSGDTITVTAPLSYAGQTVTLQGAIVVRDRSVPANLFWYESDDGNTQKMLVFGLSLLPVHWADLTFTSEDPKGELRIIKTISDGSSTAGFKFEVRNSKNELIGTYTMPASGQITIPNLPIGQYTVQEIDIPAGYVLQGSNPRTVTVLTNQTVSITFVNVKQQGQIAVKKTNASPSDGDYSVAGAVFEILDSQNNVVDTITAGADGTVKSKALPLGSYLVREKTAPAGFRLNTQTYPVTLTGDKSAVEVIVSPEVAVPNTPQMGIIRLTKTNSNPGMGNHSLAGGVFEIRNSGGTLVDTITTNAQGEAASKNLPLGGYTITEKTAPHGFVRNPDSFSASLVYAGQSVNIVYAGVTVPERPQAGKITVTKRDTATGGTAQGDAVLAGGVFEIYAEDQKTLVDTIYCGAADKATTIELPLGIYYVKEQAPPVGYTIDTTMHKVTIAYGGQDVEVVLVDGEVKNKVIEGQIALVKHTDQPMEGYEDPQIEQSLKGVIFELFLKSAGSYGNAKESERDRLETNENGYALSKKLPYGVYTVREIEAPGDVKLVAPFDVFVSSEGHIYRFILNDPAYTARLKIVKVDSTTDKTIPAAGTSFKIKNLKTGEWVKQSVWYPTPAEIDTYETNIDGSLILPEPLASGSYELHEVKAPYGYLLLEAPIKFTISSEQQEEIVTVTMKNDPVMGKLTVEKQGEMLVGTKEVGTAWGKQLVPVFGMKYLEGTAFDIIAAEDIITPDGTVRAKEGDVVDRIITGDKGTATSKALFLGNYYAVETKAPAGFVLDTAKHPVSLVYKDQLTAIVSSQIGVDNVRQAVEISLTKAMEMPNNAPEGFNPYADVVFGLFAGENIQGIIPKDALVGVITPDAKGKGVFEGDLPFGKFYVKELQTNSHYHLNETVYPIDVAYAGQDKAVSRVQVNSGNAIPNERKLGKLVLEKQGETLVGAVKTANGYTPIYEQRGLQGATFDIIDSNGSVVDTITTGKDGRAESKELPLGRYEVVETAVPVGFVLDTTRHSINLGFDGQVGEVAISQVTVLNERQKAEISVKKTWEMPANPPKEFAPWKDITFGLYAKNDILAADGSVVIPAGALIETIAIDKDGNGKATVDLPLGEYFIKEIKTASGYVLDGTAHAVMFDSSENAFAVKDENKIQRGSLRIVKTFEGQTKPIEGIAFTVVGQTAFGEIRYEVKTNKSGEIVLEVLPIGTYTVTEQANDKTKGYVLAPAQTVVITAGKETKVSILNKLAKGEIFINKVDAETWEPLAGAVFGLYYNGKLVGEARTDKDGIARFIEVPFGEYEVQELSAPSGYKRSEDKMKITVGESKTRIELTFTNERIPGEPILPTDPDEPAVPVVPNVPLPKTGDSKTIVVVALAVLIIAGGAVLWLRKRGKAEDETTEEQAENE